MKAPITNVTIFVLSALSRISVVESFIFLSKGITGHSCTKLCYNTYDEWRSNSVVIDTLPLDEENVQICLDELMYSDFGHTMFGIHDAPASIGITGEISLVEVSGPEVILQLSGSFWHSRSFVLGIAAVYLNARIPEINSVAVADLDELNDFDEIIDEDTGDIVQTIDRRSPDFNGDRETMKYQGLDPDQRGPFVRSVGGDFKIIPS